MNDHSRSGGEGVGAGIARKEDSRHLRGRGCFVSDMTLPGQQEVAFLRSPVAHGYIRGIAKPQGLEDRVFVHADLDGLLPIFASSTLPGVKQSEQPALATTKVRFAGEPVAMCVGATRAEAEDIAEQILLDIQELPAITDALAALRDPSVRVHDEWSDNSCMSFTFDKGFDEHSRNAPVVVSREITLSRQAMVPMEGVAVLAHWDYRADQLLVHTSSQIPHMVRVALAQFLQLEERQVRVISPDVGGGFGYKAMLHAEELLVAWLALKFRRPFRYVEDRREHLIAGANCRQHHYKLTAYASESGKLLALDAEITVDGGAYSNWPFTIGAESGQALGNLPGPYVLPAYRCKSHCAVTNKPGFQPYRGVARTGVCFAIELMIDAVARAVNRDPIDVRYENLVPASAMPYNNVAGKHYDSGDYPKALATAKEQIGYPALRERQRRGEADGRLIGIGFCSYCEQSAHGASVIGGWGIPIVPGYESATVRTTPDGGLEIRVGIHSHGQGLETTLAQVAHEVLGIAIEHIQVVHGDTGVTPYSTGTYASRSMVMAGGAVADACQALVERYVSIGAHLLKCPAEQARYERGSVYGPGGGSVTLKDIAQAWCLRPHTLPPTVHLGGLETTVGFKAKVDTGAFSYASHAVVVAVDPELGEVEILDYVIVEDCGRQVNPKVVEGQTFGGVAQGIGTAMYEEMQYDLNGQPKASTFADYLLPGATEVPAIRLFHMETPSPYTRFGIKGMGEGGAIGPPAAIFNAVNDALRSLGVELAGTPLTPHKVLDALDKAGRRSDPDREAA